MCPSSGRLRPTGGSLLGGGDCGEADAEAVHLAYLTPAHKRKGKGGRQPAADPRLDPGIDPKRARRILANRLSAARSKMKQKSHVEVRPQHCTGFGNSKQYYI